MGCGSIWCQERLDPVLGVTGSGVGVAGSGVGVAGSGAAVCASGAVSLSLVWVSAGDVPSVGGGEPWLHLLK